MQKKSVMFFLGFSHGITPWRNFSPSASFTFYDIHCVSEWHTIPAQWPWRTGAAALVPAGHTSLSSSQLVSLSLWLNIWSGWISLFKLVIFFVCWKYTETSIFWVKLIGQWIPDGDGRGLARDIKKNIFIFKTRQKMVTKLGQFTKLGPFSTFQLFKLSKLCYHFCCQVLKIEIFFLISLAIPRPLWSGIHWPINFSKKSDVSVYFQQKSDKFI